MEKPVLTDFNLPADYDVEKRSKAFERRASIKWWFLAAAFCLGGWTADILYILALAAFGVGEESVIAMLLVAPLFYIAGTATALSIGKLLRRISGKEEERINLSDFGLALSEWEHRNLETREGYWRRKSSKRFGEELKRFFLSRGCRVETIEPDDRHRIDLIVSVADARFYCACDGRYEGAPFEMFTEVAERAAERNCRPLVFHRGWWWTDPFEASQRGVAIFSTSQIANIAAADSLHIALKSRSTIGRMLHFREKAETLARWPVRPEVAQSTQSSPISR